jgi:hypothetical protein
MTENQLITKIAIEIAIAASETNSTSQRLNRKSFPVNFDAIEASKTRGEMIVYVEAARAILELTQAAKYSETAENNFLRRQNSEQFAYLTEVCNRLTGEECEYPDMMALSHNLDRALDERQMQRVKLEIQYWHNGGYSVAELGTDVFILQRSGLWSEWYVESCQARKWDSIVSGDAWDTKLCPVCIGETFTIPGQTITATKIDDKSCYAITCKLEIERIRVSDRKAIDRLTVNLYRDGLKEPWRIINPDGFLDKKQDDIFDFIQVNPDVPHYENQDWEPGTGTGIIANVKVLRVLHHKD